MSAIAAPAPTPAAATTLSTAAAEWLKLRSVRSTWWFVGGSAAVMLLATAIEPDNGGTATMQSIDAATTTVNLFMQYVLGALGVLAASNEYANRSITVTVACTPSRSRVMLAKALVVASAVLAAGIAIVVLGVGVAAARFGELGMLGGRQAADIAATGGYLASVAVIGLGLGTMVRRTTGALTILVLLVLVVPAILELISDWLGATWILRAADFTPSPAGFRLISGEWEWGLVLLAWVVAAVAGGIGTLRARDL
jgi:ABC-2 type transport system permease protein